MPGLAIELVYLCTAPPILLLGIVGWSWAASVPGHPLAPVAIGLSSGEGEEEPTRRHETCAWDDAEREGQSAAGD